MPSDTEMDKDMREAYFTISREDPDEVIDPNNFAQEVAAAEAPLPYTPVAAVEDFTATGNIAGMGSCPHVNSAASLSETRAERLESR